MPETYGYVPHHSRPRVSELAGSDTEPNASRCWPPAWRFLTSIRTSASPGPPVPTAGGAGTLWTPGWPRATPWLWCPSTASGGAGWTPWATSTTCNGADVRIRSLADNEQSWAQYLDADPDSPESFLGYTLAGFAAGCPTRNWCPSAAVPRRVWRRRRRTAGNWALPRRLSEEQEAAAIEMVASGVSQRRVAGSFGVSPATIRRAVSRE